MFILIISMLILCVGFVTGTLFTAIKYSNSLKMQAFETLSREEFEQFQTLLKKIR